MKEKVIYIRCGEETFREWRLFVVSKSFKNYEEALRYLLALYKSIDVETFRGKK